MEGGRQTWIGILIGALAVAVVGLGVALAIVISDDDSDQAKTVTRNVTVVRTQSGSDTTTTTTTNPSPPTKVVRLKFFKTATRNIGCAMSGDSVRCDIRKRSWSPPPKPADCDVDWGQGVAVDQSGKADFVCAGDTTLDPTFPTLAYGEDSRVGDFNCASRESGVTCTNLSTEHGFLLNQERYKLF